MITKDVRSYFNSKVRIAPIHNIYCKTNFDGFMERREK